MEYLDNCRLCLEAETARFRTVKITEEIQTNFYELTNTELAESPDYSNKICKKCCNELKNSTLAKKKFLKNQQKLKEIVEKDVKPKIKIEPEIQIKQEIEENMILLKINPLTELPMESEDTKPDEKETPAENQKKKISKKVKSKKTGNQRLDNPDRWVRQLEYQKQKVICEICSKFFNRHSLKKHQDSVHKKIKNCECDLCGKKFYKKSILNEHILTHLNQKNFVCNLCGSSFKSKQRLNNHNNVMHKKKYVVFCHICGLEFNHRANLEDHLRGKHLGQTPFSCETCNRSFSSKAQLNTHQRSHQPADYKTCPICSKQIVDMTRHMRLHTGYTNRCDFRLDDDTECGKTFRNKSRLNEHIDITHKGQKKWICKYCEASFCRSNQLNNHIRGTHLGFKANCVVPGCHGIFTAKKSLAAHLRMVHKNIDEDEFKMYNEMIRKIPLPKIE